MFEIAQDVIISSFIPVILPLALIFSFFGRVWLHAAIQFLRLCTIIPLLNPCIQLAEMKNHLDLLLGLNKGMHLAGSYGRLSLRSPTIF